MQKIHFFFLKEITVQLLIFLPVKSPRITFSILSFPISFKMFLNLVLGENLLLFVFPTICLTLSSFNSYITQQYHQLLMFFFCLFNVYESHLPNQIISNFRAWVSISSFYISITPAILLFLIYFILLSPPTHSPCYSLFRSSRMTVNEIL